MCQLSGPGGSSTDRILDALLTFPAGLEDSRGPGSGLSMEAIPHGLKPSSPSGSSQLLPPSRAGTPACGEEAPLANRTETATIEPRPNTTASRHPVFWRKSLHCFKSWSLRGSAFVTNDLVSALSILSCSVGGEDPEELDGAEPHGTPPSPRLRAFLFAAPRILASSKKACLGCEESMETLIGCGVLELKSPAEVEVGDRVRKDPESEAERARKWPGSQCWAEDTSDCAVISRWSAIGLSGGKMQRLVVERNIPVYAGSAGQTCQT
mmetsp:Transcript_76415/g.211074  ORF Transcript_76415/g.211074 Transcript_76415/m.211074 type:complete len:266 (-) Transcript_76415:2-799(-)